MKPNTPYLAPQPYDDLPIYDRLDMHPETFSDEQLRQIAGMYVDRNPRGRNARLPAKAFLILEKRYDDYTNNKKGKI